MGNTHFYLCKDYTGKVWLRTWKRENAMLWLDKHPSGYVDVMDGPERYYTTIWGNHRKEVKVKP